MTLLKRGFLGLNIFSCLKSVLSPSRLFLGFSRANRLHSANIVQIGRYSPTKPRTSTASFYDFKTKCCNPVEEKQSAALL